MADEPMRLDDMAGGQVPEVNLPATANANSPYAWPTTRKVLSTRVNRIDGPLKVSGRAKYSYDVKRPGMLYARILRSPHPHARIKSILRKADPADLHGEFHIQQPEERRLALQLLGFRVAVEEVAATLEPHRLATYLYETASAYTSFYEACPVLKTEDETIRRSRLALCSLTARVLSTGLSLLGIEAPERM